MVGYQDPFQDLSAEDGAYGLSKLNQFIDMLAADRLAMYRRQRAGPFTVTADVSSYTIGSGGTWNVARPAWIDYAGVIYTAGSEPNPELPIRVLTVKEWSQITVKSITSTLPQAIYYDQTFTSSGYGTIYLYPVPSEASQIVLYLPIAVAEFTDLVTTIALPPGYRAMLVSNLAVVLGMGVLDIPVDVQIQANKTLGNVKASNVVQEMDAMSCDAAVRSGNTGGVGRGIFNWIDGSIGG